LDSLEYFHKNGGFIKKSLLIALISSMDRWMDGMDRVDGGGMDTMDGIVWIEWMGEVWTLWMVRYGEMKWMDVYGKDSMER